MQEQKDLLGEFHSLQAMIQSSGKLVLIDKLLPKLKEADHKVSSPIEKKNNIKKRKSIIQ